MRANGVALYSDSIFKEEITTLSPEIDKLKEIKAVKYKLKADEKQEGKEKKTHYGFLAQDLEKIYPDMIHTDQYGYKSIFYTELIPVLLGAIQQQQAEIERQAALISDLDKRLEKLEKSNIKELKKQ